MKTTPLAALAYVAVHMDGRLALDDMPAGFLPKTVVTPFARQPTIATAQHLSNHIIYCFIRQQGSLVKLLTV